MRTEFGRLAIGLASLREPGVRVRCAEGRGPSFTLGLRGVDSVDEWAGSDCKAEGRVD